MVQAQETSGDSRYGQGVVWPAKTALYAVMALQSEINPRLLNIARELAGGSIIMLPSTARDCRQPRDSRRSGALYRLARLPSRARGRRVLKLVWDLIGEANLPAATSKYEKFYGGAVLPD